jgi:uncharacterized membrane protein
MRRFLLGYILLSGLVFMVGVAGDLDRRQWSMDRSLHIAASVVAIPSLFAALAAGMVQHRRPRRMFDPGACRGARAFCCGVLASTLAVILGTLAMSSTPRSSQDALYIACASVVSSALVVWTLGGRRRPGFCLRCGYDVSASLAFGRCPECGAKLAG